MLKVFDAYCQRERCFSYCLWLMKMDLEDKFLAKGTVLMHPCVFLFRCHFLLSLCCLFNSWYNRWLPVENTKEGGHH